jgi:hypothetical protein
MFPKPKFRNGGGITTYPMNSTGSIKLLRNLDTFDRKGKKVGTVNSGSKIKFNPIGIYVNNFSASGVGKYAGWIMKRDGRILFISDLTKDVDYELINNELKNGGGVGHQYKIGDKYRSDFDYDGMLEMGLKADVSWGYNKLMKLYNSFEDVNYHTIAKPLWEATQNLKEGNADLAESNISEFHNLIKESNEVESSSDEFNEFDSRLRYANEDIDIATEEGGVSITDTLFGVINIDYSEGVYLISDNKGKELLKGSREEAIKFVSNAYVFENVDENYPKNEIEKLRLKYPFEVDDFKIYEAFIHDGKLRLTSEYEVPHDWAMEMEEYMLSVSEFEEGGSIDSVRRFTEGDFNKLMDDNGFRATWSGYVWEIYPEGGGKVLGKFNPHKNTLFILGNKDLTNELVAYLKQNSYVSNEEYFKLKKGGVLKSKKSTYWIYDALSGGKSKGALRRTAMSKGLLRNAKENLSMTDLHKLEKMGGKTAKRAFFAQTLRKFNGGGKVGDGNTFPDNYLNKTDEQVWNSWSYSQRRHFLDDHRRSPYLKDLTIKTVELANKKFSKLPYQIQDEISMHTLRGQY